MTKRTQSEELFDPELADLPSEIRWREWTGRVEAVIFASPEPVGRDALARVVGRDCSIDLLIDDIREDLRGRPYERVAGGWQHRTRKGFAGAIRAATGLGDLESKSLSSTESLDPDVHRLLPADHPRRTRAVFGKEVSRDTIGHLRGLGFIVAGLARRSRARPTPMSRPKPSYRSSGSRRYATCPTGKRSKTLVYSARRDCWRAIFRSP